METEKVYSASDSMPLLDRIFLLCKSMAEADSRLRIVKNEEDKSTETQKEAATFLKLDDKRLGRDLELYNFMATLEGERPLTARLLEEIVLPLKRISRLAFRHGIKQLQAFNMGEKQNEWDELLNSLSV